MKCIYCGSEESFNKEHVIPQFLGNFEPINPTITATDRLICFQCNSVTFSGLETEFIEDSWEGITAQMLNINGANSVRIRGRNVKMTSLSGLGNHFFNDIFPFLKQQDGKFVIEPKAQVKVRNYGGEAGYQVFSLEALQRIKDESNQSATKLREFNRVKERLKMSGKDNIAIFIPSNNPEDSNDLDSAIEFLKDYNVQYNEKHREFTPIDQTSVSQFETHFECSVTINIRRLIAKVAFNYFAFCALQNGHKTLLYEPRFNRIKQFIIGDETDGNDVVISMSNEPIMGEEKLSGNRFVGHNIVFYGEDSRVRSRLSFLGGKVYTVDLGEGLPEFNDPNFGCGHLFYPFDHAIHNLTQQLKDNPTEEEIKESFGLFRRIDLSKK
jgi:hypothetical protein